LKTGSVDADSAKPASVDSGAEDGGRYFGNSTMESEPWHALSKKRDKRKRAERLQELRHALDTAAGGDIDSEDVAEALWCVLQPEERQFVSARFCNATGSEKAWVRLGRSLASHLRKSASRRFGFAMMVLCIACRDAGFTSRRVVKNALGLYLWRGPWMQSASVDLAPTRTVNCCNGREGLRKLPTENLKQVFTENATESCKLVVGHGRGRERVKGEELMTSMSFTDSVQQIWLNYLKPFVSLSTVYRNWHKDLGQFYIGKLLSRLA